MLTFFATPFFVTIISERLEFLLVFGIAKTEVTFSSDPMDRKFIMDLKFLVALFLPAIHTSSLDRLYLCP